jgi:hypothetical protein
MKGLTPFTPLNDETIWGTAALKHAISWQHIDDEGFGTVATNMVGSKYWVLARRRRDDSSSSERGNMGTVMAFGGSIRPTSASPDLYEHEGILLTPGSVL